MIMMMLLFLLLFSPKNLSFKVCQNWVCNGRNVAFIIVVVDVIVVVVPLHVVVVAVINPINLHLKFG